MLRQSIAPGGSGAGHGDQIGIEAVADDGGRRVMFFAWHIPAHKLPNQG